jgi:hypothetical protein
MDQTGSKIQPWATEPAKSPNGDDRPAAHTTSASAPQPHVVTLWSGTPLLVKVADTLSTDRARKGQLFRATLQSPVVSDGVTIAEAGAAVTGQVIESKRAGKFGSAPDLRLILVDIHSTDNQTVRVETVSWNDRGRSHNPVTGPIRSAIGAVSGVVTRASRDGAIVPEQSSEAAVRNGRDLILPANAVLQFRLAAPVSVTEQAH